MSEHELQVHILALCRTLGVKAFHSTDATRDVGTGYPDLTLVGQHGVAWAELKTEHGRMDREQTVWGYRLRAAGQRHYVWRPSDLASGTVRDVLDSL